jgi:hypothetical protein
VICSYPGWAASWGLLSDGHMGWVGNSLYALPDPAAEGMLPTSILKRLAMQHRTVRDLRSVVDGHGLRFAAGGAFTFGDREGSCAVLECVAGRCAWTDVHAGSKHGPAPPGWAVHANHVLSPALQPYEDRCGGWGDSFHTKSQERQARLEALLGDESLRHSTRHLPDVAELQAFLADHGDDNGSFPICYHQDEHEIWTTAAYVVDLQRGELHVRRSPILLQLFANTDYSLPASAGCDRTAGFERIPVLPP